MAEVHEKPRKLFDEALKHAETSEDAANQQFFSGLVSGIESRDPALSRKCVRKALRSKALKSIAIDLIGSSTLNAKDLELVASLVTSGDVEPWQCASLSYGQRMAHLPSKHLWPLIDALFRRKESGTWPGLEIIFMYWHGGRPVEPKLAAMAIKALLSKNLLRSNRSLIDAHRFESMIKTLANAGQLRVDGIRGLMKQLLRLARPEFTDASRVLAGAATGVLTTLISMDAKEVWDALANAAKSDRWLVTHRLNSMVAPPRSAPMDAGPLFAIPASAYLKWVRKDPNARAHWIAQWLPLAVKLESGALGWHPAMLEFLNEFHSAERVLGVVGTRLYPLSWWGSIGDHLQPALSLLEALKARPELPLRRFAELQARAMNADIAAEARRDVQALIMDS